LSPAFAATCQDKVGSIVEHTSTSARTCNAALPPEVDHNDDIRLPASGMCCRRHGDPPTARPTSGSSHLLFRARARPLDRRCCEPT
jgi:hypothetical protein